MPDITRALIPAAGFGTRLHPLTRAIPKEMLPLGRKPVLEYIVEELAACGIQSILIVVSPGKDSIRSYFGDGEGFGVEIDYAIQPEMRGLGDALLHGEDRVLGESFLVAFGDCIIESSEHAATKRLLETQQREEAFASVLTQVVDPELVSRYGIVAPSSDTPPVTTDPFQFRRIVEKPRPEAAASRFAVAARWSLAPQIFDYIRATAPDRKGEVGLSQAVDRALADGSQAWGVPLLPSESRVDIGSWDSYLSAAARAIFTDVEAGAGIRESLCGSQR